MTQLQAAPTVRGYVTARRILGPALPCARTHTHGTRSTQPPGTRGGRGGQWARRQRGGRGGQWARRQRRKRTNTADNVASAPTRPTTSQAHQHGRQRRKRTNTARSKSCESTLRSTLAAASASNPGAASGDSNNSTKSLCKTSRSSTRGHMHVAFWITSGGHIQPESSPRQKAPALRALSPHAAPRAHY